MKMTFKGFIDIKVSKELSELVKSVNVNECDMILLSTDNFCENDGEYIINGKVLKGNSADKLNNELVDLIFDELYEKLDELYYSNEEMSKINKFIILNSTIYVIMKGSWEYSV